MELMEISADTESLDEPSTSQLVDATSDRLQETDPAEDILDELQSKNSKETMELIRRCLECVRLYFRRYGERAIPFTILRRMISAAAACGIADMFPLLKYAPRARGHTRSAIFVAKRAPVVRNAFLFLKEISRLESVYGNFVWDSYFISSRDLFARDEDLQMFFTITVISVVRSVYRAVSQRDWAMVGLMLSQMDISLSPHFHGVLMFRFVCACFALHFPNLFLAAMQRFLESGRTLDEIDGQVNEAVSLFRRTSKFRKDPLFNASTFYDIHRMMFNLANSRLIRADLSTEQLGVHLNPQWTRVLYIYQTIVDYERWRLSDNATSGYLASRLLDALHNHIEHLTHPSESLLLIPPIVHLSNITGDLERLVNVLENICQQEPYMLCHFHRILVQQELDHVAGQIFERVMPVAVRSVSGHHFVIDVLEQRSLQPTNYGVLAEVVSLNLRVLFDYLDYGRNRADERAWKLLEANFAYVGAGPELLKPHWESRSSWWPRFHCVSMPKRSAKVRQNVMNALMSL